MNKFNILFSSDLHGNLEQYQRLLDKAKDEKADAVIIGGDLFPKTGNLRTVDGQRSFLEEKLLPKFKELKKDSSCEIYLLMGNDDFIHNVPAFEKFEAENIYKIIHNKCLKLNDDFEIIGYSYVPLTPFTYKDWEKLDLDELNEYETRKSDFTIWGYKWTGDLMTYGKLFDLYDRQDTIEKDLNKLFNLAKDSRKVILVSHSPPSDTNCDVNFRMEHIGSNAIRKVIEERQPYLTLHGHIHETIKRTGEFKDKINETICASSSNHHEGDLAVISFNLYDLNSIKREVIHIEDVPDIFKNVGY